MNILWGAITAAAGLFMLVNGILKSNFVVYRLLVARSRMLWGDHVHTFYQVAGVAVLVVGILIAVGVFKK